MQESPHYTYRQSPRQSPRSASAAPARDRRRTMWDRIWKNSQGHITIWQTPNATLIGWAAFTTVSLFFNGHTADVLSLIASLSLIIWSLLEIFRGVNYFRRALGLVVLMYAVAALVKTF